MPGKRPNPTLVGAFILGASLLVVAAVSVWGSRRLFERHLRYVCYFEGSVNGLAIGAAVKYRGVPIGEVTQMIARFEQAADDYRIPVFVELSEQHVRELGSKHDSEREIMRKLIESGLRARLDSESFVTGQLYVNLDVFPNSPAHFMHEGKDYPEIPTVPTQLEQISKALTAIVDQLQKVDLTAIAKSLEGAVAGINHLVNTPSVAKTLDELPAAVASAKKLLVDLDTNVGHVGPQLSSVLDPRGNTFSELLRTFSDVQHAAQSVRGLADFLERNPNSLLVGRKKQ